MKEVSILGIDLAKNVFHLCGLSKKGEVVLRQRVKRSKLLEAVSKISPDLTGMESCSGASYWARELIKQGKETKLIAPQFVKPYVKTNKNDYKDAEAIAEALTRPTMCFVPIKEIWQQDIQCIHRIRERLVVQRTALGNQIRGFLAEYGIVVAKSISKLIQQLPFIIENASNQLTEISRELFEQRLQDLKSLEYKIAKYDLKIQEISRSNPLCQRLEKIEGVGPITATAILSAVADANLFRNGRHLAAWIGLVPRQNSTGGKARLLGISKRGNNYLRKLLIHGARSVVRIAENKKGYKRYEWILKKRETRGYNKACVALANKNARTIWALLKYETKYKAAA